MGLRKDFRAFNATLRNLTYRLRAFRDNLPLVLEQVIRDKESVIVSAVADDQLYRRGVNGKDIKIMSYAPYRPRTIAIKKRKGQPTTRVTLRDKGDFHKSMYVHFDPDGFYIRARDSKTDILVGKYGIEIFRLTDKNLTRLVRVHIRRELKKRLRKILKNERGNRTSPL